MAEMRARIKQLLPHLFLIDDAGEGTCYLLCGSERALLIDTANGQENLKEIVEKLTHLPVRDQHPRALRPYLRQRLF